MTESRLFCVLCNNFFSLARLFTRGFIKESLMMFLIFVSALPCLFPPFFPVFPPFLHTQ